MSGNMKFEQVMTEIAIGMARFIVEDDEDGWEQ